MSTIKIDLSEEDSRLASQAVMEIADLHRNLGILRQEYIQAERAILSDLDKLVEKRDMTLRFIAERLGIDAATGKWVYDPATKAFLDTGT